MGDQRPAQTGALEQMHRAGESQQVSRPVPGVAAKGEAAAADLPYQLHRPVRGELTHVDGQPGPVPAGEDEPNRPCAGVLHQDAARLRSVGTNQGEEPPGPSLLVQCGGVEHDPEGQAAGQLQLFDERFLLVGPAAMEADLSERHHPAAAEEGGQLGEHVVQPSAGNGAGVDAQGDVAPDAGALQPRQLHVEEVPEVLAEPT